MTWKRMTWWSVLIGGLAAVGYGVHLMLPPVPRWELQGPFEILGITSDNQHFWTIAVDPRVGNDAARGVGARGPLQQRELAGGALVAEYLKSEPSLFGCLMSPSGRFVVWYDSILNCLHLIDSKRAVTHTLPLHDTVKKRLDEIEAFHGSLPGHLCNLEFSPNETYLLYAEDVLGSSSWSCLIETATGRIKSRFDSARFKAFLRDGTYGLLSGKGPEYVLWNIERDTEESERFGTHAYPYDANPFGNSMSANGRFLLTCTKNEVAVWDMADWHKSVIRAWNELSLSPSGCLLIDVERIHVEINNGILETKQQRVAILDGRSAKRLGGYQIDGRAHGHVFSHDESMCLVSIVALSETRSLEMIELPTGNRLWTKPVDGGFPVMNFTAAGGVVAIGDNLELWDPQTGVKKFDIWNTKRLSGVYDLSNWPSLSKDRKLVFGVVFRQAAAGWWDEWAAKRMPWLVPTGIAFVADASDGRELLQVPVNSHEVAYALLSDDGQTLLLSQTDVLHRIYDHRAYDVPARPRWGWVIGVPAGVCGTVLSLRHLWRRSRSNPQNRNCPMQRHPISDLTPGIAHGPAVLFRHGIGTRNVRIPPRASRLA